LSSERGGRISVVKRRHGLDRCRYKGFVGMNRWVGLGVIADNLITVGRAMEAKSSPQYAHPNLLDPTRRPPPAGVVLYHPIGFVSSKLARLSETRILRREVD
jgi:hypothetical protein